MLAICRFLSLLEAGAPMTWRGYEAVVRPLAYEFGLVRGQSYAVLGLLVGRDTSWVFIAERTNEAQVIKVPAPLLEISPCSVPARWRLQAVAGSMGHVELLPLELAVLGGWFEKWANGDLDVLAVVAGLIDRASRI